MPFPALVLLKLHWNEKNAIFEATHGRVHGNESRFEVERLWMGMHSHYDSWDRLQKTPATWVQEGIENGLMDGDGGELLGFF